MPMPPQGPDYFDKVNYVIDAWSEPCEAPWFIYVETLKPALITAFITLITFGWDDVARGFFRPRGLGPRRTGKRKGKWAKRIPRFPEIGNTIGANIPGADSVKGWKWNSAGKTLWRIDTISQAVLFAWLVVDVTIDLAYNWTSLLYNTHWCQAIDRGRFANHKPGTTTFFGSNWFTQEFPVVDYVKAPLFFAATVGFSGPRGCTVGVGCDFEMISFPARPASSALRIINAVTGDVFGLSGPATPAFGFKNQHVGKVSIPPNTTFKIQVWTDADFVITSQAQVFGTEAI